MAKPAKNQPRTSADWQGVIDGMQTGLDALNASRMATLAERDNLALEAAMGDQGAQDRIAAADTELVQARTQTRTTEAAIATARKKKAEAERIEQAAREVAQMAAMRKAIGDRRRFLTEVFQPAARAYAQAIQADLAQRRELAAATGVEFIEHRRYSTAMTTLAKELNQLGIDHQGVGMERFAPNELLDAMETGTGEPWMMSVEQAIHDIESRGHQPTEQAEAA